MLFFLVPHVIKVNIAIVCFLVFSDPQSSCYTCEPATDFHVGGNVHDLVCVHDLMLCVFTRDYSERGSCGRLKLFNFKGCCEESVNEPCEELPEPLELQNGDVI